MMHARITAAYVSLPPHLLLVTLGVPTAASTARTRRSIQSIACLSLILCWQPQDTLEGYSLSTLAFDR